MVDNPWVKEVSKEIKKKMLMRMKMEIQCIKICPHEDYKTVYVENHRGKKRQNISWQW